MKILLPTISALLFSTTLFGQGVQVTEQQATFSSGEKTALPQSCAEYAENPQKFLRN
jgi:hypothetical protein